MKNNISPPMQYGNLSSIYRSEIPETDKEVNDLFKRLFTDELLLGIMINMYICRRGLGDSVVDAMIYCMKECVKPIMKDG